MSLEFKDSVLAGYQGWFATPKNPILRRWNHWSLSGKPRPGSTAFELYPDVRDYPRDCLHRTGYGKLGDGRRALLYDSEHAAVVRLHFRWMQEYGINGAVLQRFAVDLDGKVGRWRSSTASRVKAASEERERTFYIMYDISSHDGERLTEIIVDDFTKSIRDKLGLLSSPRYARQNGRPVVAIWGFGFKKGKGTPQGARTLIKRLKNDEGCYVIGGVPYYWNDESTAEKKEWLEVYKKFNMLIPWSVGRYETPDDLDRHFREYWLKDKDTCKKHNIDMKRVIFPGFAWSNLKSHQRSVPERALSRHVEAQASAQQNQIPRLAGEFFWKQAYLTAQLGTGAYIAMFDEYDEATAIAKAAEDKSMVPSDEYFLTLDEDGTRVSSDFYLRLAGEATRMIEGKRPITEKVPVSPYPEPHEKDRKAQIRHGYEGLLGRGPKASEMSSHAAHFASGGTVLEFCTALATSDEFLTGRRHLSAEELADELYRGILEREADRRGRSQTIEEIQRGRLTNRAAAMLDSDEFRKKFL